MNNVEKAELLKDTITHLHSKEGRSNSYISRLLSIDRKVVGDKIKEWGLTEATHKRHLTPSNQKFVNKNRNLIKSLLDNNVPITQIAIKLGVGRDYLQKVIIPNDDVLSKAKEDYINRCNQTTIINKEVTKNKSSHIYNIEDLPGEEWKEILGYDGYMVSNMGRIKKYVHSYNDYYLLTPTYNKVSNRPYISLYKDSVRKNLQLSRIVAFSFVAGYDDKHNTVNHKDGDVTNCCADNIEWVSQSENNVHAYRELGRPIVSKKKYDFKKIIYKNKYEFKTVTAFSKFINKSETQTRRYLDAPEKYDIKLVK